MSEPPAVGPDRARMNWIVDNLHLIVGDKEQMATPTSDLFLLVQEILALRAALAASGAGPTVRDAAFQQAIDFAEQHVDDNNPDAAFMAKTIAVGLDALRLAGAGPTEPSELVTFFREEEVEWGSKGDYENWSTERAAIELIRHLRRDCLPTSKQEPDRQTIRAECDAEWIAMISQEPMMARRRIIARLQSITKHLMPDKVRDNAPREQEPASDRFFEPQPVDAPPREKP